MARALTWRCCPWCLTEDEKAAARIDHEINKLLLEQKKRDRGELKLLLLGERGRGSGAGAGRGRGPGRPALGEETAAQRRAFPGRRCARWPRRAGRGQLRRWPGAPCRLRPRRGRGARPASPSASGPVAPPPRGQPAGLHPGPGGL